MVKVKIVLIAVAALVWLAPVGAQADEKNDKLKRLKDRIEKSLKHEHQRNHKRHLKKHIKSKKKKSGHPTNNEGLPQLKADLDEEIQNRTDADSQLQEQIDNEVKGRTAADSQLQEQIDNELKGRTGADSQLQEQINNEVKDRIAADLALKELIEELESAPSYGPCPVGMVQVGPVCIDKFEASVWPNPDGPDGPDPQLGLALDDYNCNDTGNDCKDKIYAQSIPDVKPSRFITWFQAQQACANSGKRLLTNAEWQMAAAGTPDPGNQDGGFDECNTSFADGVVDTGSRASCTSNWLVHDMVGNVWEWVADWSQAGTFVVDGSAGLAYGDDSLFKVTPAASQGGGQNFPAAVIRGGRYKNASESDTGGMIPFGRGAGVFTFAASVSPSFDATTIGFRCAR